MDHLFVKKGAARIVLMDISQANIEIAKNRNTSRNVEFLCQDATQKWKLKSNTLDFVFSDMILNEIRNIPMSRASQIFTKSSTESGPRVRSRFTVGTDNLRALARSAWRIRSVSP